MKYDLAEMKKKMELSEQERKIALLHDEQKKLQLELQQEKQQKRELAKEAKKARQIEKPRARQDDLAEISSAWNTIFGRDHHGRGFLERLGAFAFKYVLTYACTWWPLMFLAGSVIFDHPKENLILLGISIFAHLLAFYFGSRGWLGYTQLARRHQRFWGVCAAMFIVFTIVSIFIDTSFVKWLFLRPE